MQFIPNVSVFQWMLRWLGFVMFFDALCVVDSQLQRFANDFMLLTPMFYYFS